MNVTMTLEAIGQVLATTPMRRVRTGLGGSHTVVTYPPLDTLAPRERRPTALSAPASVNYYIHIAFCEWMCSFCHYAKAPQLGQRSAPAIEAYLDALEAEADAITDARAPQRIETIYIGGGTPTSLDVKGLARVLDLAGRLAQGARPDVCCEVSPITMAAEDGREKLAQLSHAGVNRLSIGVQSFDTDLLGHLRGHDLALLVEALERLGGSGISLNIDLIQDLPGQTDESIENDLRWIERLRPQQVTWYILRFQSPSPMGRSFDRGRLKGLPDDYSSVCRRHRILEGMARLGYSSEPGCRFRFDGVPDRYKALRGGVDSSMIGLGASAYSHSRGWFWRNVGGQRPGTMLDDYVSRIRATGDATGHALELSANELATGRICNSIRRYLPRPLPELAEVDALRLDTLLRNLTEVGLVNEERDGWTLSWLGKLFEEEIVSLFYSDEIRRNLRTANADWSDDFWFTSRAPENLPLKATPTVREVNDGYHIH